jgi:isopentenyl diphosphate isomerase/L-lactate dehydrogenase-like FMN-dependent dehydrogenase
MQNVVVCFSSGYDAEEALKHGADAIWVSNHGGRELDCIPATV